MKKSTKAMMTRAIELFEKEAAYCKHRGDEIGYKQALKKIDKAEKSMLRWEERKWEV